MEEAFEDSRGELSETLGGVGLPLWGRPTCSWKTRNLLRGGVGPVQLTWLSAETTPAALCGARLAGVAAALPA